MTRMENTIVSLSRRSWPPSLSAISSNSGRRGRRLNPAHFGPSRQLALRGHCGRDRRRLFPGPGRIHQRMGRATGCQGAEAYRFLLDADQLEQAAQRLDEGARRAKAGALGRLRSYPDGGRPPAVGRSAARALESRGDPASAARGGNGRQEQPARTAPAARTTSCTTSC